jgi:transcriptional regulator with XRE-family HTH domain
MKKVEAVRVREGMTKAKLAAALGTTTDALRNWMTGRTVGRKETVAKIKDFLKRSDALEAFKSEAAAGASVGYIGGRLIKKEEE